MIIIETMGNMLIGKRKILNKEMDVYTTGAVSLNTVKIWSMIGGVVQFLIKTVKTSKLVRTNVKQVVFTSKIMSTVTM